MLDHLSPELIELVFSHLDRNSLRTCLEVSRVFKDIILYSPDIMKKLTLRITDKNWMSRLQFIKDYGMYVKNVEIYCNSVSNVYFRLLHFMPKIIKLKLDFTNSHPRIHSQRSFDGYQYDLVTAQMLSFMECGNEVFEKFNLTKLEDLHTFFYKVDPTLVFKELENSKNLKKLCIRCSAETHHDYGPIVSFLCQQENLNSLELKVGRMDLIFSHETIDDIKWKLQSLTLIPSYYADCDYTYLNKFLLTQSECLEELRVFSWRCEDEIADGIANLKALKRLTTHGLLPYFRRMEQSEYEGAPVSMDSLTHFRYYKGNRNENFDEIDTKSMPNLKCLNVHFGIDHRLFGHYPDIKVSSNPLRHLKSLKEFHVESRNQDMLHYLSSFNLETLLISYEEVLFDVGSWTQMAKNLPKLETLIIGKIQDEKFLNFILENHENFIQKIKGLKFLVLHYIYEDVLKLCIEDRKVKKVIGTYCYTNSILLRKQELLGRKFEKFDLTLITKEEYEQKYEYMQFYFHPCGP